MTPLPRRNAINAITKARRYATPVTAAFGAMRPFSPTTNTAIRIKVSGPNPDRITASTFTNLGAVWKADSQDGSRDAGGVVSDV